MFEAARQEVDSRCNGAMQLFDAVCATGVRGHQQRAKGVAFVEMYAFYEYAVHSAVKNALSALQVANLPIAALAPGLQALAMNPAMDSVRDSGARKRWISQLQVFQKILRTTADIQLDVFPTDGSHFRKPQLELIWQLFDVSGRIVPDRRLYPLIGELVERRNAVAHGRERPEDIGRMYSTNDVRKKFRQSRRICRHILTAIERRMTATISTATHS